MQPNVLSKNGIEIQFAVSIALARTRLLPVTKTQLDQCEMMHVFRAMYNYSIAFIHSAPWPLCIYNRSPGTNLLVSLLVPMLISLQPLVQHTAEAVGEARIVIVASHAHAMYTPTSPDKIDFEGLGTGGSETIDSLSEVQASLQRLVKRPESSR